MTFFYVKNIFKYYQQNKITQKANESILRIRESNLRYLHAGVRMFIEQLYTLSISSSDWLQHACSVLTGHNVSILEANIQIKMYSGMCIKGLLGFGSKYPLGSTGAVNPYLYNSQCSISQSYIYIFGLRIMYNTQGCVS